LRFDISSSIVTVGPTEPAVLLALLCAATFAWVLGRKGIAPAIRYLRARRHGTVYVGLLWLFLGVFLLVATNLLLVVFYAALHPEEQGTIVCVAVVWSLFLLPPAIAYLAAARTLRAPTPSVAGGP
jgi:hypothetical protein